VAADAHHEAERDVENESAGRHPDHWRRPLAANRPAASARGAMGRKVSQCNRAPRSQPPKVSLGLSLRGAILKYLLQMGQILLTLN
jgi:hypothetical protein